MRMQNDMKSEYSGFFKIQRNTFQLIDLIERKSIMMYRTHSHVELPIDVASLSRSTTCQLYIC